MAVLLMFIALAFLTNLFSGSSEESKDRERLILRFIWEYEKRTGITLTQEQAAALIPAAYALLCKEEAEAAARNAEHHQAETLALKLCLEAERKVFKRG